MKVKSLKDQTLKRHFLPLPAATDSLQLFITLKVAHSCLIVSKPVGGYSCWYWKTTQLSVTKEIMGPTGEPPFLNQYIF